MFSAALRSARKSRGVSLNSAARTAGIDPGHMYRVETGKRGPLSVPDIMSIAKTLDIDPFELLVLRCVEVGSVDNELLHRQDIVDEVRRRMDASQAEE